MASMKRKMNLDNVNPALLVLIAGLLSLFAAYISQTRQSKNTSAMRQQLDLNTNLMREMAAQTGNKQMLQEVIDLRLKLLASEGPADDDVEEILAQVPRLTEEYRRLQNNQSDVAERLLAGFRVRWEPLVRFAVAEFDKRIETVIASGEMVALKKDDSYRVAGIGQDGGNGQLVRVAQLNGVELRLYCSSGQVHPTHVLAGYLAITVRIPEKQENESSPLNITLAPPEPSSDAKAYSATESTGESKNLANEVVAGINKGIKTFLVLAKARR